MSTLEKDLADLRIKPEIIKFTWPGLKKQDVRLVVLGREYHVHSTILKLHSAFFRAFFDSPDKTVPASTEFDYEWVTMYEEDTSWHLVANGGPLVSSMECLVH